MFIMYICIMYANNNLNSCSCTYTNNRIRCNLDSQLICVLIVSPRLLFIMIDTTYDACLSNPTAVYMPTIELTHRTKDKKNIP